MKENPATNKLFIAKPNDSLPAVLYMSQDVLIIFPPSLPIVY